MAIPKEIIDHVKRWEGLRLTAYPDPGSADGRPWTIGYGHTSDAFMRVAKGMTITEAQAELALIHDLGEAGDTIDRLVKVPLTDGQRGALISFVFNIGEPQFAKSTLLKRLNAGDYDAVPGQLGRWVHNDGRKLDGLVNRRAAEIGLWAKGSFVSSRTATAAPLSAARQIATPEGLTAAGGLLAGLTGAMSGTGPVQWAMAAVIVLSAVYLVVRMVRQ